jgi:ribose transport system substrate-binding protein
MLTSRKFAATATAAMALAALLTLAGCVHDESKDAPAQAKPGEAATTSTGAGASAGGKHYTVGFAQANSKDPYRQVQNAALTEAAKSYPDIILTIQDAADNNETQIGQVETFLTQKIDLLLISPNEAAPLTPVVGKVFDAKIPVVLMERGINSDKFTMWLGGDNKNIGRQAGEYLIKITKGQGKIVEIMGKAGATPTNDRHQGFIDAINAAPGLKVVDSYNCNYQREPAQTYMENVLQKHTDFNIIYAHNDEMALGAVKALKAAGKDPKNYIIIGIDGVQEEVVRAIMAGDMTATFEYNWLGKEAMDTAHKILTGSTVPHKISLPTQLVTKDNAADYLAHLPK